MDGAVVLSRLERALNVHDLELLVGSFDERVVSEQPVHPSRSSRGRARRPDGGIADLRGVTLFGVEGDRIRRVRYMEPVEQDGAGIDEAIREHVGRS